MINDPLARLKAMRSGQNASPAGADPLARLKALRSQPRAPGARNAQLPARSRPIASAGPFAALQPIVSGARAAAKAGGSGLGKVLDLLSRPGMAAEHFYSHGDSFHPDFGGALNVFLHSESQDQQNADRANIRQQLGVGQRYSSLPHWAQGALDIGIDTITDPTTFIGGGGAFENVGRRVAPKMIPLAQGASRAVSKRILTAADRMGHGGEAQQYLDHVNSLITGLYDMAGPHNKIGREAVNRYGEPGRDIAQTVVMARNASRAQRTQLENTLLSRFRSAVHGLNTDEENAVYRALHTGTQNKLPDKLQLAAKQLSDLTDSIAWLQGTKGLRNELARNGFQLPEELKPFDEGIRRIQTQSQYRRDYLPIPHASAQWMDEEERYLGGKLLQRQSARKAKYAESFDPNLMERGEGAHPLDADLQRAAFENRMRAAARSIAGRDTRTHLAEQLGQNARNLPGFIEEYLQPVFKAPEDKHAFVRLLDTLWRGTVDIPKQALFALPFRHMMNISVLTALHDPGALAEGMKLFFQQYGSRGIKSEAERRKLMRDAYNAGVLSVGSLDRARPWTQRIPGVKHVFGTSSNALWAFDDAMKTAAYRRAIRKGLSPQDASRETLNALIDYGNRSDVTNALSYVAPFATYRSKLPGAIARATLKHPERPLTANRIAPALMGGEQPSQYVDEKDQPQVAKGYTPAADIYSGIDDPWGFARTTMSWPAQVTASALNWNPPNREQHYFTYGFPRDAIGRPKPWGVGGFAKYAANQFPYLQNVMPKLGMGVFPDHGFVRPLVEGQTGIRLTYPKRETGAQAHDPATLRLHSIEGAFRTSISDLKQAGDNEGADLLDRVMQAKVKGDEAGAQQLMAQFTKHRIDLLRQTSPVPR